jgi:hypothetical protein
MANFISHLNMSGARGRVVVEVLCYKSEGRRIETLRYNLIFPIYLILPAALGLKVYLASNRNEYQEEKWEIFLESRE